MTDESSPLHSNFLLTNSGTIIDSHGSTVVLFGVNEFNEWWASFESYFQAPIGRKLIYAACDDEEHHLGINSMYTIPKWFGKASVLERMNQRWIEMGWGVYMPGDSRIQSPCHDALGAGFALAHHEHQNGKRYQMEWRQINTEFIQLEYTEKLDEIPLAPKAMNPSWVPKTSHSVVTTHPLEHDFESRTFGFFMGQERAVFLPVSVFYRLFHGVLGRPFQLDLKWPEALNIEGLNDTESTLTKALASSSSSMFKGSDYTIFVQTQLDWESHINTRITSRGLGSINVEEFTISASPMVRMTLHSPLPGLTLGLLIAMWERAHGVPCTTDVTFSDDYALISLHPRKVEYS